MGSSSEPSSGFGPAKASHSNDAPLFGEVPFFLRVDDCPVYAVYHPARLPHSSSLAALLVPPLGVEHLSGYRSEVLLARELAATGVSAIRFHPRGQGDSGGDSGDLTLESFAADVCAVAAELRRRSHAAEIVGVGVRFGALALGRAIWGGETIRALALLDPVEEPRDYFRAMLRGVLFSGVARRSHGQTTMEQMLAALEREGRVDVLGYYLHRRVVESCDRSLGSLLSAWNGPVLLAQIDTRHSLSRAHAELAESLSERGLSVETRAVRTNVGWPFPQNPVWESPDLVHHTTEWIHALA